MAKVSREYWNDKLYKECYKINDRIFGIHKFYYEHGSEESNINYIAGIRYGKFIRYHVNGNICYIYNHIDDILNGKFEFFTENCILHDIKNFKNNKQHGEEKCYSNNVLYRHEIYENDKLIKKIL